MPGDAEGVNRQGRAGVAEGVKRRGEGGTEGAWRAIHVGVGNRRCLEATYVGVRRWRHRGYREEGKPIGCRYTKGVGFSPDLRLKHANPCDLEAQLFVQGVELANTLVWLPVQAIPLTKKALS